MNITDGGTVSGGGFIGYGIGSTGVVNVDGVGSYWDMDWLNVGYQGTGNLNVTNGGTVTSGQTIIGGSAVGDVSVDGPGSYWYSNHDIQVSKGELAVTNQAVVVSALPMLVYSQGKLSGNGTIGSDVVSRGLVAPVLPPIRSPSVDTTLNRPREFWRLKLAGRTITTSCSATPPPTSPRWLAHSR